MNILITGATKGIGRAIAFKMAFKGFNLSICSRNIKELEILKEQIRTQFPNSKVYIELVDCSSKNEVQTFAHNSIREFGFIDVLVNNVGIFQPSFLLDEEDFMLEKHMQVNVYSAYYIYKILGLNMREQKKGHIFNICSVASLEGIENAASYSVTKAALLSLNNIMRKEMMQYGVKVTAVIPGSTLTDSWSGTKIPQDQFVLPEDVANIIDQVLSMSKGANVDQIVVKPLFGQI
jgi:3-oxoacyl-[acyl-carrier protein] reductase